MALDVLDIVRIILYALDFIFGVLSWGITADKLKFENVCNAFDSLGSCNAIIGLGVIAMIALIVVVMMRILDWTGIMTFSDIFETISFGFMTLIWVILSIITLVTSDSASRRFDEVNAAIAGAWLAMFTHAGSMAVSFVSHRRGGKE